MTPAVFAFLGHLVDNWLGTGRVFTLGFGAFVAGYVVWKLWYQYNAEMDQLQAELRGGSTAAGAATTGSSTAKQ